MPLQNRVDPFGEINAVPQRGLLMGNRGGRIHDPATKTLVKRRYSSRRWIICECVYKDWHREVMGSGYTELFFLDEVTALAAGHRPCAFCRREAFRQYRACCQTGHTAGGIDLQLHGERLSQKPSIQSLDGFPDSVMVAIGSVPHALQEGRLLPWTFEGYRASIQAPTTLESCRLLTPFLTVTALRNGYQPQWHPSARFANAIGAKI